MILDDPGLLEAGSLIGGVWVGADSGATFSVHDPASGDAVGSVADLGVAETRRAIEAAAVAQKPWAALTAIQRGVILRR